MGEPKLPNQTLPDGSKIDSEGFWPLNIIHSDLFLLHQFMLEHKFLFESIKVLRFF